MNQFEMKQCAYQSTLKSRALQVLIYLIDRSNKEYTCFPAIPTISRELHISTSTVKRALHELEDSRFVKKESRYREGNRGQTSNLYTLSFQEVKQSANKGSEKKTAETVEIERYQFGSDQSAEEVPVLEMEEKCEPEYQDNAAVEESKVPMACYRNSMLLHKEHMPPVHIGAEGRGEKFMKGMLVINYPPLSILKDWTGEGVNLVPP